MDEKVIPNAIEYRTARARVFVYTGHDDQKRKHMVVGSMGRLEKYPSQICFILETAIGKADYGKAFLPV